MSARTVEQVVENLAPEVARRLPGADGLVDGQPLALLAFKGERRLELWKQRSDRWEHVKDYEFSAFSGRLGPKLRQGDLQIPEGIYRVEYLNPMSSYHLSIKIDYPNDFDRKMALRDGRTRLGGDIFLHGRDVTIGCIPLGDPAIEELFYLVARNGPSRTRVIIAPCDLRTGIDPPEIPHIDWEADLYRQIREALAPYPR